MIGLIPIVFLASSLQRKLLNPLHRGDRLPRHLGVANLNDADILVKIFLPAFSESSQQHQDAILQFLVNNWDRLQANPALCYALSQTHFVPTGVSVRDITATIHQPRII